jgi:metal-responsive CopG/Arc/MetJ family transcriptional regulator
MSKRKPEQDAYTPVKLPNSMIEQVDRFIENQPQHDFRSRPQFITYLIRRYIDEKETKKDLKKELSEE